MNWTTAWLTMKQGHKENGEEVNFRKVKDIGMMLNVTCCDDWEQVMEG